MKKYSDKEIIAAINLVHQILEMEEFELQVNEYAVPDENGNEIGTELAFNLVDIQGANLGDIENDSFGNLASVIDRMTIYHNDYLYEDYDNRVAQGEEIPQDDYDRKILIFLESDYCTNLLFAIDVNTYTDYVKTSFSYHDKEDRLKENEGIDELKMLIDKSIC